MPTYLVTFTPLEPYFLGAERNYRYPDSKEEHQQTVNYIVVSESLPSQTTLFGAIRFLGIPTKKQSFDYTPKEKKKMDELIGEQSFNMLESNQSFGAIESISPLFIVSGTKKYYPLPLNHNAKAEKEDKKYTPFKFQKNQEICTSVGMRLFPDEYSPKKSVEGFMDADGNIVLMKDMIFSTGRFGNNTSLAEDSLFKKEYKYLGKGYAFAIYLEASGEYRPQDQLVFLGQGKSTFKVHFQKAENDYCTDIHRALKCNTKELAYAASDLYVKDDIYAYCTFVATQTRDFRLFSTNFSSPGKSGLLIDKSAELYKFIRAGSVFYVEPKNKEIFQKAVNDAHIQRAGMNHIIFGGGRA